MQKKKSFHIFIKHNIHTNSFHWLQISSIFYYADALKVNKTYFYFHNFYKNRFFFHVIILKYLGTVLNLLQVDFN
jgi:hypothetical protein